MVEESHIHRVLEMVWNTTLGKQIRIWDDCIIQPDIRNMLASYIRIHGGWDGLVCIHVPASAAREAAAHMFDILPELVNDDDIADAMGELANQVGGNLKLLLPPPCRISLPQTMDGPTYLSKLPDAELLLNVVAECEGLPLVATLVETLPSKEEFMARYHQTA